MNTPRFSRIIGFVFLMSSSALLRAASATWDITAGNSQIDDGSGTWTLANVNWTSDGGSTDQAWSVFDGTSAAAYFSAASGTSDTVTVGGTVTVGSLIFGQSNTASTNSNGSTSYTLTGGTITMGSAATVDTSNSFTPVTIASVLAGSGSQVTFTGNTVTLTGANTYSGGTVIDGANLGLDFSVSNPGAILASGSNLADTAGGGNLVLTGNASADSSQTLGTLTLNVFLDVKLKTAAGHTLTLTLGSLVDNPGAGINFNTSGSGTAVINYSGGGSNALLVDANNTPIGVFNNGADWAAKDGSGHIVSGTTAGIYTTASSSLTAATNADMAGSFTVASGLAVKSLRFNSASADTLTIGSGATVSLGGVLVTGNVGAAASSIAGPGSVTSANSGGTLLLANGDAGGTNGYTFGLGAVIVDNGAGHTAVSYIGATDGAFVVTGTNTYTGNTYVGGAVRIGNNAGLGSQSSPGTLVMMGGVLQTTATMALDNGTNLRPVTINGGGTFDVASGTTLTLSGVISGTSGTLSKDGSQSSGGSDTYVSAGLGTLRISGSNTYSGGTNINNGLLVAANANALGTGTVQINTSSVTLNGASATFTGTLQVASGITLNAGNLQVQGGVLDLTQSNAKIALTGGAILALQSGTWKLGAVTNGQIALTSGSLWVSNGFTLDLAAFTDSNVAGSYTLVSGVSGSGNANVNFINGASGYDYSFGNNGSLTVAAVPEPAAIGLSGAGLLAGLAAVRRRKSAA